MLVEYTVTDEDYLDFNLYHFYHSPSIHRSLRIQQFLAPVMFLVIPFIFRLDPLSFFLPAFIITALLWLIFYPRYFHWFVKRRTAKFLAEGDKRGITGNHTLQLTPDEIIEVSETGEMRAKWASVEKIEVSEKQIFIYLNSVSAILIPLHSFRSDVGIDEFIDYANKLLEEQKTNN